MASHRGDKILLLLQKNGSHQTGTVIVVLVCGSTKENVWTPASNTHCGVFFPPETMRSWTFLPALATF